MRALITALRPIPFADKSWGRTVFDVVTLLGLLAAITAFVYATNGTDGGYTYLMLIPVLVGAARYGARGGVATGVIGALLLGPYMPDQVGSGVAQPVAEWLVRLAVFVAVGLVIGGWRDRLAAYIQAQRNDPTTDLGNAVALYDDLDRRLQRTRPSGPLIASALMRATDLDDIVDVTGVEGADRVIETLAHHIETVCPEVHRAYRFSGSSLAFIVEASDVAALKRVVRTMHNAASSSIDVSGTPVRVEPVMGLGHGNNDDDRCSAHELFRRGRVALRRATDMEKDWVSYEPAFETDNDNTCELIARVERALADCEFELHYQPKIRLRDDEPVGTEALARWHRPSAGVVPPGSYMPKLEKTSLIDQFSRFVIRTATQFAHAGFLVPVSINLAPRNLADEALVDSLIDGLERSQTPGHALEIEITESALMREPENAIGLLGRLRQYGIGISIDDFGTGYSSFAYLRRLPATNLKIDRAFIRPLEGDARSRRLVLAMIESGHALGMSVTAEGIETRGQAQILADYGCDLGQGFLWSPARPASELHRWFAGYRGSGGDAATSGLPEGAPQPT